MYNVPICKTLKLKKGLLSFYHSCVFLCLNMSHLAQCRAPHLGNCLFLSFLFVLHFRCRTLSGSPRPKSFKKVHFVKNMRQHDMRNGRYEAKHRLPAVDTSPHWIMEAAPVNELQFGCFSHYKPHRRQAGQAPATVSAYRWMQLPILHVQKNLMNFDVNLYLITVTNSVITPQITRY